MLTTETVSKFIASREAYFATCDEHKRRIRLNEWIEDLLFDHELALGSAPDARAALESWLYSQFTLLGLDPIVEFMRGQCVNGDVGDRYVDLSHTRARVAVPKIADRLTGYIRDDYRSYGYRIAVELDAQIAVQRSRLHVCTEPKRDREEPEVNLKLMWNTESTDLMKLLQLLEVAGFIPKHNSEGLARIAATLFVQKDGKPYQQNILAQTARNVAETGRSRKSSTLSSLIDDLH